MKNSIYSASLLAILFACPNLVALQPEMAQEPAPIPIDIEGIGILQEAPPDEDYPTIYQQDSLQDEPLQEAPPLQEVPPLQEAPPLQEDPLTAKINSDSAKKLAKKLKGIGKKKAKAIVKYREKYGNFESVDDLAKVKGINKKLIKRNIDVLSL